MEYEFKNFVGIFNDAFSKEYCDSLIQQYEHMISIGLGSTRQKSEDAKRISKDDMQLFADQIKYVPLNDSANTFNTKLWSELMPVYEQQYSILKEFGSYSSYYFKIQKTEIGGGYHVWHCEDSGRNASNRIHAWILYLNDVEEGGETEFLYYPMRVKPKAGTFIVWPAGFTHTHRGNPPISNEKYIVTGWTEF